MVASIQQAMTSLYHLEAVTIDPSGKTPLSRRDDYKQTREDLRKQWEATIDLLRRCISFGEDVPHLKRSLISSSKEDIRHFLEDMASKCKECIEIAEELTKGCVVVVPSTRGESHIDQCEPGVDPNYPYSDFAPSPLDGSNGATTTGPLNRSTGSCYVNKSHRSRATFPSIQLSIRGRGPKRL